jgi:hypothetical protein
MLGLSAMSQVDYLPGPSLGCHEGINICNDMVRIHGCYIGSGMPYQYNGKITVYRCRWEKNTAE